MYTKIRNYLNLHRYTYLGVKNGFIRNIVNATNTGTEMNSKIQKIFTTD